MTEVLGSAVETVTIEERLRAIQALADQMAGHMKALGAGLATVVLVRNESLVDLQFDSADEVTAHFPEADRSEFWAADGRRMKAVTYSVGGINCYGHAPSEEATA